MAVLEGLLIGEEVMSQWLVQLWPVVSRAPDSYIDIEKESADR